MAEMALEPSAGGSVGVIVGVLVFNAIGLRVPLALGQSNEHFTR